MKNPARKSRVFFRLRCYRKIWVLLWLKVRIDLGSTLLLKHMSKVCHHFIFSAIYVVKRSYDVVKNSSGLN